MFSLSTANTGNRCFVSYHHKCATTLCRQSAFGAALRADRLEKAVTQEQLAWATGISPIFISNLERGLKEPCLNTIATLCEALNVPISDVMLACEKALRRLPRQ
jgi:transcriptional regulator with XRE-family HTH domain